MKKLLLRTDRLTVPAVRKTRTFSLQVNLHPYNQAVLDVLNCLETDCLNVLDGEMKGALSNTFDAGGEISVSGPATKRASIRRWLAAGCQAIRWGVGDEITEKHRTRGVMAMYWQNSAQVMFPIGVCHVPPGPAAFVGEIIVNAECFPPDKVEAMTKRLQFVIAHELTHVFDMLRQLVPALENWRRFWRNVVEEGGRCEDAILFKELMGTFVDDYGSENELAIVKQYWPSKADEWFAALRGK